MKLLIIITIILSMAYLLSFAVYMAANMPTPSDFRDLWNATFNKKDDD